MPRPLGLAQPLRLAFMGSPEFAVPSLAALLAAGHEIIAVYAQPARPAGRGQRPRLSPVHAYAERVGLMVRTPSTLRTPEAQADFAALDLDAAIVAAYGLILPPPILAAPRMGCFNVHASLLPRWRGAAPIQRAILAGDSETGITIMQMDAGLDTGPIVLAASVPIEAGTNAGTLHDRLAATGARLIVEALSGITDGTLVAIPQPAEGATYAHKLNRDEGRIDWRQPAVAIERMARAFDPWPGAWFELHGDRIKVLSAACRPDTVAGGSTQTGTVLDACLSIACGQGVLRPTMVQRQGRAPLPTEAFLRGYPVPAGTRLT